jgi:hypothetical protein
VATKPALKLEPAYRSGLEKKVADQLEAQGVEFEFEKHKFKYDVPARVSTYTPDFLVGNIFLEAKGMFGRGPGRFSGGDPAKERAKLLLIKAQYPSMDLRIIFQRAAAPIYKGSKTTLGKWATDHNIPWADKGQIPEEWLNEMRESVSSQK